MRNEKGQFAKGNKGRLHPQWLGNNVGYMSLHKWIANNFKKPKQCQKCGTSVAKRFEWANLGTYNRDRKNWLYLCVTCHHHLDRLSVKLDESKVKRIRELYSSGVSQYKIASLYKINQSNVSYIIRRKTWQHVN
jgi:hypothetical protein